MDKVLLLIEIAKGKKSQKELAKVFKTTQQTISYNIKRMEEEGLIKERKLTEKGIAFLVKTHKEICSIFFKEPLVIKGKVFSGVGEGKKFLGMKEYKKRIKEIMGFSPYEGTLNIKIDEKDVGKRKGILGGFEYLSGFQKQGRSYGGLFIRECSINGVKGAVVIPVKSRYGYDVLEVISPHYLRKKLNLKDGDKVSIVFV